MLSRSGWSLLDAFWSSVGWAMNHAANTRQRKIHTAEVEVVATNLLHGKHQQVLEGLAVTPRTGLCSLHNTGKQSVLERRVACSVTATHSDERSQLLVLLHCLAKLLDGCVLVIGVLGIGMLHALRGQLRTTTLFED